MQADPTNPDPNRSSPAAGDSDAGSGAKPGPPGDAAGEGSLPKASGEASTPLRTWLAFLLPFALYMALNSLEPAATAPANPPTDAATAAEGQDTAAANWLGLERRHYPLIYILKIGLVTASLAPFWPVYRQIGGRISPWAWLVGAVGTAIWVGVCKLGLEDRLLGPLGLGKLLGLGARTAFDPLTELGANGALAYGFLAIRFIGLALVVPVIEELFLRGFVMRYLTDPDWWKVSLGAVTPTAIAITTALAMAMHPAELFAELIWFSSVTLLMLRTRNLWDCVVAHGVTNLLLGIYVVATGEWHFW
ncbi:MAG: CAAX prenyl protease-related protein [Pirellulales bacterium]